MCFYGSLRDVRKECKFFNGECNSWGEICLLFPQQSSKNKMKKEWRFTLRTLNNLAIFSLARIKRRAVEIPGQSLVSISGLQLGISVRRTAFQVGLLPILCRDFQVEMEGSSSCAFWQHKCRSLCFKSFFVCLIWLQNGSNLQTLWAWCKLILRDCNSYHSLFHR